MLISKQRKRQGSWDQVKTGTFFKPFIQTKLTINQPNDIYEQEADSVSRKIMQMPATGYLSSFFKPKLFSAGSAQRKYDHCEEEESKVQMKSTVNTVGGMTSPSIVQNAINSSGQPLDAGTRNFMESRFGYDFGNVQIHNDSLAHQSSAGINALAYTHGNHIVFGDGQFKPDTISGKRLLAHELTHVVQQRSHSEDNFIQRSPRVTQADLGELAKWPDLAKERWKSLDEVSRTFITLQIAATYGDLFAKRFLASINKRQDVADQHYGVGVGPTPAKLIQRGYVLVQRDSLQEWWIHPSGIRINRAIFKKEPTASSSKAPEVTPSIESKRDNLPETIDWSNPESGHGDALASVTNPDLYTAWKGKAVEYEDGTIIFYSEDSVARKVLLPFGPGAPDFDVYRVYERDVKYDYPRIIPIDPYELFKD